MDAGSPIISGTEALDALLRAAAEAPHAAALFCDIDGTISPIAPTPAEAHVPDPFRELLARLVARLGLVAFVTGRSLEDGRRMIPLDGAAYVGTHGLQTMAADGSVSSDPQAERYVDTIRDVREAAQRDLDCDALGVVLEDKRTVLAVHYRLAGDAAATRHQILQRVDRARARARPRHRHGPLPVRDPAAAAVHQGIGGPSGLLTAGDYFSALGCGDDLTDVTMFAAVRDWGERDARRHTAAVAAVTDETPQPVTEAADVLVRATSGVHEVLSRLAAAVGA